MPRPHIEFIFAQSLAWAPSAELPGREDLSRKLLSCDETNGELTAIVAIPPGWSSIVTSAWQEELYILDGGLAVEDQHLARDGYFRLPAAAAHRWSAPRGAVVLLFANEASPSDERELVGVDAVAVDWSAAGVPEELDFMRLVRKPLFVEAGTGHMRTWLLSVAPQVSPRGDFLAVETHDCVEEVFMLSGDITGPRGEMTPGAYFWRPRDTLHGPFGSRNGGMAISRWRHGRPDTHFHGSDGDFGFEAPYRPALPAGAAASGPPVAPARF